MRHAARGKYRQRIRACHPKQVMADKSGRQHFGNPHDILARYACTDSLQTTPKSQAALARSRTRDLLHASRHLYRQRHDISKYLILEINIFFFSHCLLEPMAYSYFMLNNFVYFHSNKNSYSFIFKRKIHEKYI